MEAVEQCCAEEAMEDMLLQVKGLGYAVPDKGVARGEMHCNDL